MLELARLYLRKDRLVLLLMAATVLLSLPLALAGASKAIPTREALGATWLFWCLIGLPGFAVVFGAASGARLSSDAARANENLLPISAPRRAWAAVLSSGSQVAALAALLLLLGLFIRLDWGWALAAPFRPFGIPPPDSLAAFACLFACCLPVFLLLSLLGAYVCRHGVVGAILGAFFGMLCLGSLASQLVMHALHPHRAPFGLLQLGAWAFALAGSAAALSQAASRLERKRRTGWGAAAGIAVLALGGTLLAVALQGRGARDLSRATRLSRPRWVANSFLPRWSRGGGALLESLGGDLIWVTPDGARKTLLPANGSLYAGWVDRANAWWDAAGTLWVLSPAGGRPLSFDLFSGAPERGLKLVSHFVPVGYVTFMRRGDELGLWSREDGYAKLPAPGRQPSWEAFPKGPAEMLLESALRSGAAARYDVARGTVLQRLPGGRTRTWRVSPPAGKTLGEAAPWGPRTIPGATLGGRLIFPLTVREAGVWRLKICLPDGTVRTADNGLHNVGEALLKICLPDGTVRTAWTTEEEPTLKEAEGGGLWDFADRGRALAWLAPDGAAYGPVPLGRACDRCRALRAEGSRLWAVNGDQLFVLDGKARSAVFDAELPPSPLQDEPRTRAIEAGFFWHTGRTVYFVDWGGKARPLGR